MNRRSPGRPFPHELGHVSSNSSQQQGIPFEFSTSTPEPEIGSDCDLGKLPSQPYQGPRLSETQLIGQLVKSFGWVVLAPGQIVRYKR